MGKKINEIRHLISELANRYGDEDGDVQRLKSELAAIEAVKIDRQERRKATPSVLPFKPNAKRIYQDTTSGDDAGWSGNRI